MKMITYIYLFALYILFIPGFLRKTKPNMQNYLLHALLFSLVLYLTYDLVNQKTKENYNEYDVNVTGVNSLVDLIKTQFGGSGNEKKIDIHNQIAGSQGKFKIQYYIRHHKHFQFCLWKYWQYYSEWQYQIYYTHLYHVFRILFE
jgi:hypothetical protein